MGLGRLVPRKSVSVVVSLNNDPLGTGQAEAVTLHGSQGQILLKRERQVNGRQSGLTGLH